MGEQGKSMLHSLFARLLANQSAKAAGPSDGEKSTVDVPNHLALLYTVAAFQLVIAAAAITLNACILLVVLCRRPPKRLDKEFCSLVASFTAVDVLKALCLTAYALQTLTAGGGGQLLEQTMLFLLRFCNLATILNLSLITFREFWLVEWPFFYSRTVTPCRVRLLIAGVWLLCAGLTVFTLEMLSAEPSWLTGPCPEEQIDERGYFAGEPVARLYRLNNDTCLVNLATGGASPGRQLAVMLAVLAFCLACLAAVLLCYSLLLRKVRAIKKLDEKMEAITYGVNPRPRSTGVKLSKCEDETQALRVCNDPRTSVISTDSVSCNESSSLTNRKKALQRHKYIIVIGSVSGIYMMYLIVYGGLQIHKYLLRTGGLSEPASLRTVLTTSVLQASIGVHSILQPMCYFRMTEFKAFLAQSVRSWTSSCVGALRCAPPVDDGRRRRQSDHTSKLSGAQFDSRRPTASGFATAAADAP